MVTPWLDWVSGRSGHTLYCRTCYERLARGRKTTLRSGLVPIYKTDAGAVRHVERFPRHVIEATAELAARELEALEAALSDT